MRVLLNRFPPVIIMMSMLLGIHAAMLPHPGEGVPTPQQVPSNKDHWTARRAELRLRAGATATDEDDPSVSPAWLLGERYPPTERGIQETFQRFWSETVADKEHHIPHFNYLHSRQTNYHLYLKRDVLTAKQRSWEEEKFIGYHVRSDRGELVAWEGRTKG